MKRIIFLIFAFLPVLLRGQNKQFTFREGASSGVVTESQLVTSWTNVVGKPLDSLSTNSAMLNFTKAMSTKTVTNILMFGDSRTEFAFTPNGLMNIMCPKFGHSGMGSFNLGWSTYIPKPNLDYSKNAITLIDQTGIALRSVTGQAAQFAQNSWYEIRTASSNYPEFTDIDIYYPLQSSSIIYSISVDGVSNNYTTNTGTTGVGKFTVTGLQNAAHTIRITQTSTGTGVLFEINFKRISKGIRFHQIGNGGITTTELAAYSANTYLFQDIQPDLTIIRIGVNGMSGTSQTADTINVQTAITNIRNSGGKDIVVVGETDNTGASRVYVDKQNIAYKKLCDDRGYLFVNFKNVAKNWAEFIASGNSDVGQDVHENAQGGRTFATYLYDRLTRNMQDAAIPTQAFQGTANRLAWFNSADNVTSSDIFMPSLSQIMIGNTTNNGEKITASQPNSVVAAFGRDYGSRVNGISISEAGGFSILGFNNYYSSGSFKSGYSEYAGASIYPTASSLLLRINGKKANDATVTPITALEIDTFGQFTIPYYNYLNTSASTSLQSFSYPTFYSNGIMLNKSPADFKAELALIGGTTNYVTYKNGAGTATTTNMYYNNGKYWLNNGGNSSSSSVFDISTYASSNSEALRLRAGNPESFTLGQSSTQIIFSYSGSKDYSHRLNSYHTGTKNGLIFYTFDNASSNTETLGDVPQLYMINGKNGFSLDPSFIPQYALDVDATYKRSGNPLRLTGLLEGSAGDSLTVSNAGVLKRLHISNYLSGTTGYISKFTTANKVINSTIYESSTGIGIGNLATNAWAKLQVSGATALEGRLYLLDAIQGLSAFPGGAAAIKLNPDGGAVIIGNKTATGATVDVLGTGHFSGAMTATQFNSNIATGTAPFTVASTTLVSNLNSNFIRGLDTNVIVQRNTVNAFTENATFAKKVGIGGAVDASYILNVTGSANITNGLNVANSLITNSLTVTGAASNTTNTEVLSINAGVVSKQAVTSLKNESFSNVTVSTSLNGSGHYIITFDGQSYSLKTTKYDLSSGATNQGIDVSAQNIKDGGIYTLKFINIPTSQDIIFSSAFKQDDGTTNMGTQAITGTKTFMFVGDGSGNLTRITL